MLTDRVRAVGAAWLGQTTGCASATTTSSTRSRRATSTRSARSSPTSRSRSSAAARTAWSSPRPRTQKTLARLDAAVAEAKKRLEAVAPQLDARPGAVGGGPVALCASRCPSSPATRRPPTAEKSAARAVQAALEEGRDGAQRRRNARRSRPTSARRPRRCSRPSARPSPAPSASARRSTTALPKCLVSVSSADAAHRAHPAARQLDGRDRRGREAGGAAFPAAAGGRQGAT